MRVSCRRAPAVSEPGGTASATGRARRGSLRWGAAGKPECPLAAARTRAELAKIVMHAQCAHLFMAHVLMAHVFMAHVLMAHVFMAHVFMAHVFMAHVFMAHVFMAPALIARSRIAPPS